MPQELPLWIHAAAGTAALGLYWLALAATKGSDPHRRAGRRFLVALALTVLTVAPLLLFGGQRFDPGRLVAFAYLSICVGTLLTVALSAVRLKHAPERFRGLHFRVLGPLITVLGAVVLAAGLLRGDPVAAVLSWVGLVNGPMMMVFAWSRAPLAPRWWLAWHVHAVCVLATAVHGTLGFVWWRWAVDPEAGRADAAAWHAGVFVAALALRAWWSWRRDVPWRFFGPREEGQALPRTALPR